MATATNNIILYLWLKIELTGYVISLERDEPTFIKSVRTLNFSV